MPAATNLSRRERQIMDILYRLGSATAAEIRENLPEPPSYSTVRALLRILEDKGYLKKTLVERAHVYKPTRARQQVIGVMVKDFVDRVFDGASGSLLVHLATDNRLTAKQRQAIERLLEDLED